MSELTARIKAFQAVVREALRRDLSTEEQAELEAIMEVLRWLLGDQDFSSSDANRVSSPNRAGQCGAQSVRPAWRNVARKS